MSVVNPTNVQTICWPTHSCHATEQQLDDLHIFFNCFATAAIETALRFLVGVVGPLAPAALAASEATAEAGPARGATGEPAIDELLEVSSTIGGGPQVLGKVSNQATKSLFCCINVKRLGKPLQAFFFFPAAPPVARTSTEGWSVASSKHQLSFTSHDGRTFT